MEVNTIHSTWHVPDDWGFNEDTDEYTIGDTANFLIRCSGDKDGIFFDFKDPLRQIGQLEDLGSRIIVNIERDRCNRVHINGVSVSNLNMGFGKEIYRALIDGFGMISTCLVYHSCSESARRVWRSLLKSNEYTVAQYGSHLALSRTEAGLHAFTKRFSSIEEPAEEV